MPKAQSGKGGTVRPVHPYVLNSLYQIGRLSESYLLQLHELSIKSDFGRIISLQMVRLAPALRTIRPSRHGSQQDSTHTHTHSITRALTSLAFSNSAISSLWLVHELN